MAWQVRLSDSELALLAEVTTKRCRTKASHGVATQKHDRARTDWDLAYFGFMGEVGLARALCLQPNWSVLIGGDDGSDLSLAENKLQVKTPLSRATKDWLYFDDESKFRSDYGVLCNIDEYETSVIVRGAIAKDDFLAACIIKDFGYGERIAVHATQLKSMDDLIDAVQHQNNTTVGNRC